MAKRKNDGITHYDGPAPRSVSREMRKMVGTDRQIREMLREEDQRQKQAAKEEEAP